MYRRTLLFRALVGMGKVMLSYISSCDGVWRYRCVPKFLKKVGWLRWSETDVSELRPHQPIHKKLHNEKLHNFYSSLNIIRQMRSRRIRLAGHVVRMGEERIVYRVLMGEPEGKRPLGRQRHRREDGIRMDLREIG
jgi:hypothetical protein